GSHALIAHFNPLVLPSLVTHHHLLIGQCRILVRTRPCYVRGVERIKKSRFSHFLKERVGIFDHSLLSLPISPEYRTNSYSFCHRFCLRPTLDEPASKAIPQSPLQRVSRERNRLEREYNWIEVKRIPCKSSNEYCLEATKKCLPLRVCTRKS